MPWRIRDAIVLVVIGFAALVFTAAVLFAGYSVHEPNQRPVNSPVVVTELAPTIYYLAILVSLGWFVVRHYHVPWSTLGLRIPLAGNYTRTLLLFGLFGLSSVGIIFIGRAILNAFHGNTIASFTTGLPSPRSSLYPAILMESVLLGPLTDELLFRGVLYQALRRNCGVIISTSVSALVFGLIHQQHALLPITILLGVFLAIVFEQTQSLYPSILLNASYNVGLIVLALHISS